MIRKVHFIIWLLIPLAASATEPDAALRYIQQHYSIAVEEMKLYGIPASIKLAQGILESDSGQSDLALNSLNHFGIKCKKYWIGPYYYHPDDDYCPQGLLIDSCFRLYKSVRDSYRDHSIFLRYSSHYESLFELDITDYRSWAKSLQSIGYATHPRYSTILISLIERYQLYEYDRMAIAERQ